MTRREPSSNASFSRVAWEEGMRAFLDRWWDRALAAGLGPNSTRPNA